MPDRIPVTCPSCAGKFKADVRARGKKVRCPKCGQAIPVPGAQALLQPSSPARCPECDSLLRAVVVPGKEPKVLCLVCRPPDGVCPFCGDNLTSETAQQCLECGASWQKTVEEVARPPSPASDPAGSGGRPQQPAAAEEQAYHRRTIRALLLTPVGLGTLMCAGIFSQGPLRPVAALLGLLGMVIVMNCLGNLLASLLDNAVPAVPRPRWGLCLGVGLVLTVVNYTFLILISYTTAVQHFLLGLLVLLPGIERVPVLGWLSRDMRDLLEVYRRNPRYVTKPYVLARLIPCTWVLYWEETKFLFRMLLVSFPIGVAVEALTRYAIELPPSPIGDSSGFWSAVALDMFCTLFYLPYFALLVFGIRGLASDDKTVPIAT